MDSSHSCKLVSRLLEPVSALEDNESDQNLLCPRVDLPLNQKALDDPDGGSFMLRLGRDALVKVVGGRHFEYRDGYDYRDSTSQI